MLIEAFKSILLMSLAGSFLSLFWLALRPFTRKYFSPKWQYYIWLTALLVMVLPVSFSLPQGRPQGVEISRTTPVSDTPQGTEDAVLPEMKQERCKMPTYVST